MSVTWNVVSSVLKVSNVSRLRVTVYTGSSMPKAMEGQIERDSRILDLLVTMNNVYAFVDTIRNMADLTSPLENNIDLALKQTIECALFIREYFGVGFSG